MLTDSTMPIPRRATSWSERWLRLWGRIKRISPEVGDALLYGASALFALLTIYTSANALYEVWGRMALLPFAFGAVASTVLAVAVRRARKRQADGALTKRQHRRAWLTRIVVAACVFGFTALVEHARSRSTRGN